MTISSQFPLASPSSISIHPLVITLRLYQTRISEQNQYILNSTTCIIVQSCCCC